MQVRLNLQMNNTISNDIAFIFRGYRNRYDKIHTRQTQFTLVLETKIYVPSVVNKLLLGVRIR